MVNRLDPKLGDMELLGLNRVKMVRRYRGYAHPDIAYDEQRFTYHSLEQYAAEQDPKVIGFVQEFWRIEGRVAVPGLPHLPTLLLELISKQEFNHSHRVFLRGKLYSMDEYNAIDPNHKFKLNGCINEKQAMWERMVIHLDFHGENAPERDWFYFYPGDKLLTPAQEEADSEQLAQSA